jgi:DNA-binding YbaB/EbfC family protein
MTLAEILKAKGIDDETIKGIQEEMKSNKVFTASEENLDVRYGKLKTDHDGKLAELGEAQKLIEDLKKSNKGNEGLQQKVAEYETKMAQMQQVQAMQRQMEQMQAELEEKEFKASAGGGVVEAVVNGRKDLLSLTIDKDVVDPDDVETLQDLVIAAVNEGMRQADEASSEAYDSITGGLNIPGL